MIKKILTILLLAFVVRTLIACCNCPEVEPTYFFRHSLLTVTNLDNSGAVPVVASSAVPKEAFAIRLKFSLERTANCKHNTPAFFNTAFACSCEEEILLAAADTITSITIKTKNKFDDEHDVDADVTGYFKHYYEYQYRPVETLLNDKYLDNLIGDFDRESNERKIDLMLLTPPAYPGEHNFDITVGFADGSTLTATTTTINLQ